jgi:hypothetical protein
MWFPSVIGPLPHKEWKCIWGSNAHEEMNNCIQPLSCHVSLILRCTFILCAKRANTWRERFDSLQLLAVFDTKNESAFKIKLTWPLHNSIQLFIASCEFDPEVHFHCLCRRGLITEENQVVLFSYYPSSTQRMKVHLRIELTSQLNSCIELFISSFPCDPQMYYHSLCRRELITEKNNVVPFSY